MTTKANWWAGYAWWGVLTAVVAVGFGWTLGSYFLGDDFAYAGKFWGMSLSSWPRLFVNEWSEGMWGFPLRELRPVAALSFIVDGLLWGGNPTGYHLTNLVLHLACAGLVMLLTREVLGDGWLSGAAAGLIFALHPVHIEPVVWITGRVDTIAALAYLLGIYGLVRFRADPKAYWLAVAWVAYGAGIFAKEMALTLPAMALLCELFFVPRTAARSRTRAAAPYLGWGAIAVLYYFCRGAAIGPGLGAPTLEYGAITFWGEVAQRQLFYLGQLIWPAQGALAFPDTERVRAVPIWLGLLGAAAAISAIWLWLDRRRRTREARVAVFFGVVWFLVATLPLMLTYSSARHLYLASAGVSVALSVVLMRLLKQRVVFALVMLALVVACGWQLRVVTRPWRESGELSRRVSASIEQVAGRASPGDLLLLNVPELYEGCFMWSWASPFALRPPFQQNDLTRDLVVLERVPVYFQPEKWAEHPSFARIREAAGAAWIVSATPPRDVQVIFVERERVASVLSQPGLNLGAGDSFERLIAGFTAKQQ